MSRKRVIVLGIDGLEPKIIDRLLKNKKLPSLAQLSYWQLQTTIPPQSPVAWASFITGKPPEKHKLFDFVKRNPKNYQPFIAYSPSTQTSILQTKPFWQANSKLPIKILFLPVTYPASQLNGQMITGMGTPDLVGTEGNFQFFSTQERKKDLKRGQFRLIRKNKQIATLIKGPKYQSTQEVKESQIPLLIKPKKDRVELEFQSQKVNLKVNQFSSWVRMKFKVGLWKSIWGIAKFYLQSVQPEINLYLSPINIDPQNPFYPISFPKDYSSRLVKQYGNFATLGMPHDSWAFQAGIFNQKSFLHQVDSLLEERGKIILNELNNFPSGLFVAYLGTLDTVQHMFWGNERIIKNYYQKVDEFVEQIMRQMRKKDVFFILSDHGFGPFNYEIHLNAWLRENGYLKIKQGKTGGELLENIDWPQTKAYALGFNSLYLNLKGREKEGSVSLNQRRKLAEEIKKKLKKLKNPINNETIIKEIHLSEEPDLIIGYYRGYRGSWDTAVGITPVKIIKKRTEKWQGDHLFDASEVPGVFFANQKLPIKKPVITDIISLALKQFNLKFL